MTPADLRALAARVETEEPSDALNEAVARAVYGWWWDSGEAEWVSDDGDTTTELPPFLTDLTAAAGLMPVGWRVNVFQRAEPEGWFVEAGSEAHGEVFAQAPDEERARTAAALQAMAAGVEAAT
jgi:hypothetical protein